MVGEEDQRRRFTGSWLVRAATARRSPSSARRRRRRSCSAGLSCGRSGLAGNDDAVVVAIAVSYGLCSVCQEDCTVNDRKITKAFWRGICDRCLALARWELPLPLRGKGGFGVLSTGSAASPLHPWLQAFAPLGRGVHSQERER